MLEAEGGSGGVHAIDGYAGTGPVHWLDNRGAAINDVKVNAAFSRRQFITRWVYMNFFNLIDDAGSSIRRLQYWKSQEARPCRWSMRRG
jgi:hypothetical protein